MAKSEPAVARRRPAADRKAEIVQAAIRLAAEIGPDRVSAQQLARAVGISQPAIFRHFATKADIWLAVGQAITGRLQAETFEAAPGRALDELLAKIARNFEHIQSNPAIPSILFSRELHEQNDALRRHFDEVMRQRRAGFARLVEQARAEGRLSNPAPAEDIGALLLAAIQGLAMRWSLEGRGFDLCEEGMRLVRTVIWSGKTPG